MRQYFTALLFAWLSLPALADAYICKRGNERIVQETPCHYSEVQQKAVISGPTSGAYLPNHQAQLNNIR